MLILRAEVTTLLNRLERQRF